MQKIQKDNFIFHVDIEKTKSYYLSHSICDGGTPHGWFPNQQKEACFFVSVSGISLPWV